MNQKKLTSRLQAIRIIIEVLGIAASTVNKILEAQRKQRPIRRVKGRIVVTKKPSKRKMASMDLQDRQIKQLSKTANGVLKQAKILKKEVENGIH